MFGINKVRPIRIYNIVLTAQEQNLCNMYLLNQGHILFSLNTKDFASLVKMKI